MAVIARWCLKQGDQRKPLIEWCLSRDSEWSEQVRRWIFEAGTFLRRGNRLCKSPEAGTCLACLSHNMEARMTRAE